MNRDGWTTGAPVSWGVACQLRSITRYQFKPPFQPAASNSAITYSISSCEMYSCRAVGVGWRVLHHVRKIQVGLIRWHCHEPLCGLPHTLRLAIDKHAVGCDFRGMIGRFEVAV